ncbi:MAG: hypothetical protein AB8C02_13740 [Halioglobus sp.]
MKPRNFFSVCIHCRTAAFVAIWIQLFLIGCGGGGTDGNVTLTTNEQGQDPVVVEVPIAYIRRPAPVEPNDLRDPLTFTPGARLFIRERSATSAQDKELTQAIVEIVAAELSSDEENVEDIEIALDVKDLESSFDGNTLIFSARAVRQPVDDNLENTTWNLWTYDFEQDTVQYVIPSRIKRNEGVESGGGQDLAPSFLPDDRIVFSSTRQVTSQARLLNEGRAQLFAALDEDRDDPAAVLHIYDPQQRGDEFQQISFNLSHDLDPLVLTSGEIVFSRWNNTATDHVSLFRINPDGLGFTPLYGFHSAGSGTDGANITFSQPRELDDGRLASIAKPFSSDSLGGEIVVIDTATYAEFEQPNWQNLGAAGPGHTPLTDTDIRTNGGLSPGGQFGSVYALRDGTGRLLVTWSDCRIFDEDAAPDETPRILPCSLQPENENIAPPLYGGWVYNPTDGTQRPVVIPEDGSIVTELIAAEARDFSDLIGRPDNFNTALAQQSQGLLRIDSVYDFDGEDRSPAGIAAHATPGSAPHTARPARFLRLIQPVPIPDRDVFEIPGYAAGVRGGNNFREILGYTPIEPDGSVTLTVPANRPFSFSILDDRGRRTSATHRYWLQVGAGETVHCTGCHDHSTGLPHGATEQTRAPSSNPGAISLPGALGFTSSRNDELFATQSGETMAQVWDFHRPADNPTASERPLLLTPQYEDEWHAADITPDAAILDRQYEDWADIPLERSIVVNNFDPQQPARIVINYIDHIQPIWERVREARLNSDDVAVDTCVGCHNTAANTLVPAGQLDLTSEPSDIDPDHYRSYRELLSQDQEQWISVDDALTDRQRVCTDLNEEGEEIITTITLAIGPAASAGFANGSNRFFNCFEGGTCGRPASPTLPDNCTEEGGTAVPATQNTVDHAGLLSEPELHLISEWLDIGAQYFNNPFDARLIEE